MNIRNRMICAVWESAAPRRSLAAGLAAVAMLLAVSNGWAQSLPTLNRPSAAARSCQAEIVYDWNLGSIQRDGVEWEMRKGTPGQTPSAQTAQLVGQGVLPPSREAMLHDLRQYGPVLNGTPYLFRIRAIRQDAPASEWSPVHVYSPAFSSDGMLSASLAGSAADPAIDLKWTLAGRLPVCADRIWYEVKKGSPASSATAPDPSAYMGLSAEGTSGTQLLPLAGQGPGDYYVRIVARHGGDTPRHDVGTWAQGIRVTVPPVTHSVRLRAVDQNMCTNRESPLAGAAVRLTASGGSSQQGTTDAAGEARFSLPAGSYAVAVSHPACSGSGTQSLAVSGDARLDVSLPGCASPGADLGLSMDGASNPVGGRPYPLGVTVTGVGREGPSTSGTITVDRTEAGTNATIRLLRDAVPPLCPAAARTYSVTDPDPVAGKTYTYVARIDVADAQSGNNVASRRTSFSYTAVAATPAPPSPTPVSISSFAIRGDLPYVRVGRRVPLTAAASGEPTEFRAAERRGSCQASLGRVPWRPWSATSPPTWSFSSTGTRRICFQLRRGADATAVVSAIVEDDIEVVRSSWTSGLLGTTRTPLGAPATYPAFNTLDCGSKFAVGLDVRSNHLIDAVALRCADLGPGGEHSNVESTASVGGEGGHERELRCQSGEVLAAVDVRYGLYIDQLKIGCKAWRRDSGASGDFRWNGPLGGSGGDRSARAECPTPLAVARLPQLHRRGSIVPFGTPVLAAFDVRCEAPPDL